MSDDQEMINKQANMNILSTMQIQKSAKIAKEGNLLAAQAQIHVARNYLNRNINLNSNNYIAYNRFNNNMQSFHNNLNNMNHMNNNMNYFNNNMNMNNNMFFGNNNNRMNINNNMNNLNNNMGLMNNMNFMSMNNNMNNNMNDELSGQIFQMANTSENRQEMMFNRSNNNNKFS